MLENIGNTITHLAMDQINWDETWLVASYHVPDIFAIMRLPWQRRTGHSAVMGIWRPNSCTNFDEIWYTTANSDNNDSHVIKY